MLAKEAVNTLHGCRRQPFSAFWWPVLAGLGVVKCPKRAAAALARQGVVGNGPGSSLALAAPSPCNTANAVTETAHKPTTKTAGVESILSKPSPPRGATQSAGVGGVESILSKPSPPQKHFSLKKDSAAGRAGSGCNPNQSNGIGLQGVYKQMQTEHAAPFAVLQGVDLQVRGGEFFGLLGPSGCGKTTLLNLLAGLDSPDQGSVMLPRRLHTNSPAVAYMQQKDLLLPWYSVLRNVLLGAEIEQGHQTSQHHAHAMALLRHYGLANFAHAYVHQLSGGMRQRAALIRTMLLRQPVLLLDEPFASLDAITRSELQTHLSSWHRQQQQSVVLVTHDVDEALRLCHRIGLMSQHTGTIAHTFDVRPLEEGATNQPAPPLTPRRHTRLRKAILQALATPSKSTANAALPLLPPRDPAAFTTTVSAATYTTVPSPHQPAPASRQTANPSRATPKQGRTLLASFAPACVLGLGLVAVWEAVVYLFALPHYILPAPSAVAQVMVEKRAVFASHAAVTLGETLLGMLLGSAVGLLVGAMLFAFPLWRRAMQPFLIISQNTPVFAIAPLLVVWFGYGQLSKVVMAAIVVFFPIAMAVLEGMRSIDVDFLRLAQTMDANPWQQLIKLRIPAALPTIFAGLRLSAVYASLGAVLGEWVGAGAGLGYLMLSANAQLRIAEVFGAIVALAPMSLLLLGGLHWLERWVIPWRAHRTQAFR